MTPFENDLTPERKLAVNKAIEESDRSDLKKHATNMLWDFGRFNDFSSNRAIWELVQNACDLSTKCEVIMDYRNGQFAFTHNGRPFNSNSLISLIKQVSGDKDETSEIPPVGKYGTGFLTTHSLGRKFLINALLETSGYYVEIKEFLIDRSAKKWPELSDQIKLQKDKVFEIIGKGKEVKPTAFATTFTYLPETEQERKYVAESFRDLKEYLPLILTINNRLKSAKVISADGSEMFFTRLTKENMPNDEDIELYKTTVMLNKAEKVLYSIADKVHEIEIILPINKDHQLFTFSDRVARLFLYYPLVGSEHFGMNFIINCNKFLPTEPRDTIHLFSERDQVKDDEAVNRVLIEKSSDLLFKFLNSNLIPVANPLLYADINFKRESEDHLQNKYFNGLQNRWIDEFKALNIVRTKDGYKNATEVSFPLRELLEDDKYFESVYYMAEKFYPVIPTKETVREWSKFIENWGFEAAKFIKNEDIAGQIEVKALSDFEFNHLKNYYSYLLEAKLDNLFIDCELLPNMDGVFQPYNSLKLAQNIDGVLIEIGKNLIPKSIAQLIDPRFAFSFVFDNFNRRSFSNSINNRLNEEPLEGLICLPGEFVMEDFDFEEKPEDGLFKLGTFLALLNYGKLNANVESLSKPAKLMMLISDYYAVDNTLIHIAPVSSSEDDLDQRLGQKKVVQLFLNTLLQHNSTWVENHLDLIYNVISYNEDRFKDVFLNSKIYPNQVFGLELLADLKRDGGIAEEIYLLYNTVTKKEIGTSLGHLKFNEFLIENEELTNRSLSSVIEDIFFLTDITDINEHPFKNEILGIIAEINLEFYKGLFTRIDDNKALMMLKIVTNENTKDDIFSIVTLKESQLKKLGQLIKQPNFEEILIQAAEAIRHEKEKKSDWEHKYKIGTYIEDKIRLRLGAELAEKITIEKDKKLEADDIQGGQDIVISYDGTALYYIEVKSRWDPRNSVSMSKLQLEKASKNIKIYSLISVDVTKYKGEGDRYQLSEAEIIPLIKVINGLGGEILPLIENNMIAESNLSATVKLVDFRGIINQDIIKDGLEFDFFVDELVASLTEKVITLATLQKQL